MQREIKQKQINEEIQGLQEDIKTWCFRLQQLKSREASIQGLDSQIGFVAATSGLPIVNGRHIDWALIALSGPEIPPKSVNLIQNVQERSKVPVQLSHWSDKLEGGATVCKMVSTNVTEGVVNSVPSYVRFKETEHEVPYTIEWAVIPTAKYKSFSETGDSGAWVVDRLGNELLGMILGRNSGLGVAYVTPIAEIVRHIEYFTNKVVHLPH